MGSAGFRDRMKLADRTADAVHAVANEDRDYLTVGGQQIVHEHIGGSDHGDPSQVDEHDSIWPDRGSLMRRKDRDSGGA
jgi:hypothetical protein